MQNTADACHPIRQASVSFDAPFLFARFVLDFIWNRAEGAIRMEAEKKRVLVRNVPFIKEIRTFFFFFTSSTRSKKKRREFIRVGPNPICPDETMSRRTHSPLLNPSKFAIRQFKSFHHFQSPSRKNLQKLWLKETLKIALASPKFPISETIQFVSIPPRTFHLQRNTIAFSRKAVLR